MSKKESKLEYLAEQKLKAEIDKIKAEKVKAVADTDKATADAEVARLTTNRRWYYKKEFWFGLAAAMAGVITAVTTMLQFDSKLESQRSEFRLELAKSERAGSMIARESAKIEREMLATEDELASKVKKIQEMQERHESVVEQEKHASKLLASSKLQVELAEQRLGNAKKKLTSIEDQNSILATEKSELISRIRDLKERKRIAESDYNSVVRKADMSETKITVIQNLNDCVLVDEQLIVVGDGGVILVYQDGKWNLSNSDISSDLNSVDEETGRVIVSGNGQTLVSKSLLRILDSSQEWKKHLPMAGEIDFYDAKYIGNQVVAVGSQGSVFINEFGMPLERLEYPEWSLTSLAVSKDRLCIVGRGPMSDFTKPSPNPIGEAQITGFFMSRKSSRIRINDRERWFWCNGIGIVTIRDIWSNSIDLVRWLNEGPKVFEIRRLCSGGSGDPNQINQYFWGVATDGTLFLHLATPNSNFLYSNAIAKEAPIDATDIAVLSNEENSTELYVTGGKGIYRISVKTVDGDFGRIDASSELIFEQQGLNAITIDTDGKAFAVGNNGLVVEETNGKWDVVPLKSIGNKATN
jgi:hypothetical protein